MKINAQIVLAIVGAIMLGLAIKDWAVHRRITPAIKTRLIIAAIFAAVWFWNAWHLPA